MHEIVVCSITVNRPVRTRMQWWCGGRGLDAPGYPIVLLCLRSCFVQ